MIVTMNITEMVDRYGFRGAHAMLSSLEGTTVTHVEDGELPAITGTLKVGAFHDGSPNFPGDAWAREGFTLNVTGTGERPDFVAAGVWADDTRSDVYSYLVSNPRLEVVAR